MKWQSVWLLAFAVACGQPHESLSLDALAFQKGLSSNPGAVLIDVRTPEEVNGGFIEGAVNLDFRSPEFESTLDSLPRSQTYFVYCASGVRSGKAQEMMKAMGFEKVTSLAGGINAWRAAGLPVVRE